MRDEGPGQPKNPGIACERTVGELRQLPIVSRRQILPDLADLFLDEVIVVQQPFGRGNDTPAAFQLGGGRPVSGEQDGCIVVEPRVKGQDGRRPLRHRLRNGETLGVLLEAFLAEELFPYRPRIVPRR